MSFLRENFDDLDGAGGFARDGQAHNHTNLWGAGNPQCAAAASLWGRDRHTRSSDLVLDRVLRIFPRRNRGELILHPLPGFYCIADVLSQLAIRRIAIRMQEFHQAADDLVNRLRVAPFRVMEAIPRTRIDRKEIAPQQVKEFRKSSRG